jgi:hypothetical protein
LVENRGRRGVDGANGGQVLFFPKSFEREVSLRG